MNSFEDTTVLVTGGAGFIASHISDSLMNKGAFVKVIDDLSNGTKANYAHWKDNDRFEIIIGDLRNRSIVAKSIKDASIVFHQAAKVSVPASVRDPVTTLDVNVMGTTVLLDECRKADVNKIVVASSSSVYGDTPTLPKVETMPTNPISPYGVSKLAQENLTIAFHRTYGMNTSALRYFNVYGPRQRGGSYAGVISIFFSQALDGVNLTIESDGKQTRDFTYIRDVVECNLQVANSSKTKGKVYNVGGENQITIEKLADIIIKITKSNSGKTFLSPRQGDVRDSLANTKALKLDTGFTPNTPIIEGLEETIRWIKTQS